MREMPKQLTPNVYDVDIAGEKVSLPVLPVSDTLAISLLMVIDMGVEFGERAGKALAEKTAHLKPEIVVAPATLGIPIAIEVTRWYGLDDYVILQKSPKIHLGDALFREVQSVTSKGSQRILLDSRAVPLLKGRRVLLVDDVVATGSSLAASIALTRDAGAELVGVGVILTEGYGWKETLGEDAKLIHELGHIPQFAIEGNKATPIPDTL
jgi:adenine phosphoribosyltransferase